MIESVGIKIILAAGSFVAAGWGAHEYLTGHYAARERVEVAMQQSQFLLDLRIENVVKAIARIENIANKTPTQIAELRYLREQLAIMRRVRSGR